MSIRLKIQNKPSLTKETLRGTAVERADLKVIRHVSEIIAEAPSTRFYGSKRKLLPWIFENIRGLNFQTALDAFGGAASVSVLFKAMRKDVTYHDGFRFNEDVGRTLLSNELALSRLELKEFIKAVRPQKGFISTNFVDIYYTKLENAWLDGFSNKMLEASFPLEQASLLRYLVYQACLKKRPFNLFHRANLNLRTSGDVTRSFGNLTTWERSFQEHALQAYDELKPYGLKKQISTVLPAGNAADIPAGYDLVYLDPPYISLTSRYNRDDYWKRYHFLEGLAEYNAWPDRFDPESNIRLLNRPQWMAEWSNQTHFCGHLFEMILKHKRSIVVLSYVTDAFPSELQIKDFFEKTFKKVSIHTRQHNHALSKTPRREILFIGQP